MTYTVRVTSAARRQIRKLPRDGQERVLAVLSLLADEPRPPASKKLTGRSAETLALVEAYAKLQTLWHDADNEPVYSEYMELDLSTVVPSIAGPKRPQDRIEVSKAKEQFRGDLKNYVVDGNGIEGLEASLQGMLQGEAGKRLVIQDRHGRVGAAATEGRRRRRRGRARFPLGRRGTQRAAGHRHVGRPHQRGCPDRCR